MESTTLFDSIIKFISNLFSNKRRFLVFVLSLNFLIHLQFLNLAPCSIHVWRQCNTLAVARNFSEEIMNIFEPRVDRRLDTDGVTGMQFPAYEYVCACVYKLIGEHFYVARTVSLLLFSFSIFMIYELVLIIALSHWSAVFAAWSFCWSPELFYHSINALPDIMALACALGGLFCFLKWDELPSKKYYWCSLFLISLSGLIKIQYLMFGGMITVIVIRNLIAKKYSLANLFSLFVFATVSIGLTTVWYCYALSLIETGNLRDFGIELRPAQNATETFRILKENLISDLPELLLNYAGTVLLIIGIDSFIIQKKWKHRYFKPLLVMTIIYLAYHFTELHQMDVHHYYMLPSLFILAVIMGCGAKFLWDKKKLALLGIVLVAQPILACVRILPARWLNKNKAVPNELFDEQFRTELINAVPSNSLCVAGPDESGCIYFYYLHKKGFGYDNLGDLEKKYPSDNSTYLKNCIDRGATYLYTTDSTIFENKILQPMLGHQVKRVGNFRVVELKR